MAVETGRILRALSPAMAEGLMCSLGCSLDDQDPGGLARPARVTRWTSAIAATDVAATIEQHLADIDGLSDWLGQECLRETLRDAGRALFEQASRRRYFSHYRLSQKSCARFRAPAMADWRPSDADIARLRQALEPLLHEELRTGDDIIVDPIVRAVSGGVCVQLSIYAAGAAQRIEEVEGDDLVPRVIRPAFACVIGYWPETGGLEVVVRNGTFGLRAAVAEMFAEAALGADADALQMMSDPTIALDGLLVRPVLDFDVADGIASARVIELEVRSMAKLGAAMTLAWKRKEGDVWDAAEVFAREDALLAGIVCRAKIQVIHSPVGGGSRRSLTFELSPPHKYQPRGATAMERMIIEKYLPRWGLMTPAEPPSWT